MQVNSFVSDYGCSGNFKEVANESFLVKQMAKDCGLTERGFSNVLSPKIIFKRCEE